MNQQLYDHLSNNRMLLRALILSVQSNDPELAHLMHTPDAPIIRYLDLFGRLGASALPEVGWTGTNFNIAIRISFGFVLSLAVFDDLFFAEGQAPGREDMIEEMTAYMLYGLAKRPKPAASSKATVRTPRSGRPRSRSSSGRSSRRD